MDFLIKVEGQLNCFDLIPKISCRLVENDFQAYRELEDIQMSELLPWAEGAREKNASDNVSQVSYQVDSEVVESDNDSQTEQLVDREVNTTFDCYML